MDSRELYIKTYSDMNFERKGLFKLLHSMFPKAKVVYPGCSLHITPSFFFQHVVYIDRSEEAANFFKDEVAIKRLIGDNKTYRQSSYYKFLTKDFGIDIEAVEYQYDILISLYADDVIKNCLQFLKLGGIVISNNFHDDVINVLMSKQVKMIGTITCKGNQYNYLDSTNPKVVHRNEEKIQRLCIKNTADGVRYFDNETYYVLVKIEH